MISAVNFGNAKYTGHMTDMTNSNGEKVIIMERKPDGFVRTTVKSAAYARKAYVTAKEAVLGLASTVVSGLASGGAVLSLAWILQKAGGHGDPAQTWAHPIKAVGNVIGGILGKAAKVFAPATAGRDILLYPFVGFPKDIKNYVSNAKGIGRAGKVVAVGVGLGVAALGICKTLININRANADVDHGFKVGHDR